MKEFDENENVERIRQQEQQKKADEIIRAMNIGFYLKCLRCGAGYYHTEFAMSEMSYQMYSYCPDCIGKALDLLKKQGKGPRVLPLDEVIKSGNKLMWLEIKTYGGTELYPTSPYDDNTDEGFSVSFQSGHVQSRGFYMRQWRCWNEYPPEILRKAAKWHEGNRAE